MKPRPDCTIRKHVSNIIRLYFHKHQVVTQAHMLHGLLKHKKLKRHTKLLVFQDVKSRKACVNATKNISKAFYKFGKSRKPDVQASCRVITIVVVAPSTSRKQMVATMLKLLHVSRKKNCTSILNSWFK